jgi:hypothetical protein
MRSLFKNLRDVFKRFTAQPFVPKANRTLRARRYKIEIPLRFRMLEGNGWREARSENISSSGVLFRSEQVLEVGTPVEMSFVLPMELGEEKAGAIALCRAQIVRAVPPSTTDARSGLAARIWEYRVDAQSRPDLRRMVGEDRGPMGGSGRF